MNFLFWISASENEHLYIMIARLIAKEKQLVMNMIKYFQTLRRITCVQAVEFSIFFEWNSKQ